MISILYDIGFFYLSHNLPYHILLVLVYIKQILLILALHVGCLIVRTKVAIRALTLMIQGSQTRGPRATFGPLSEFLWPSNRSTQLYYA
jgi:hypothetical protein